MPDIGKVNSETADGTLHMYSVVVPVEGVQPFITVIMNLATGRPLHSFLRTLCPCGFLQASLSDVQFDEWLDIYVC